MITVHINRELISEDNGSYAIRYLGATFAFPEPNSVLLRTKLPPAETVSHTLNITETNLTSAYLSMDVLCMMTLTSPILNWGRADKFNNVTLDERLSANHYSSISTYLSLTCNCT